MQLQRVTQRTREALEGLRKQYRLQQNSTSNILNDLAAKMDQMYMSLGLTDGQEEAVDKTVKNAVAEALVLFENGLDFDGQFTAVLDELKKIT
jgi:hypothetical protein